MIYRYQLKRLSDHELAALVYCVNDGIIDNLKYEAEDLIFLRPEFVAEMINKHSVNISEDKKKKMQDIIKKVTEL